MAPCKLYIAASLDGFIARPDGSLDWLEGLPNPDRSDYGYAAFYASIDTVVMGRKTYEAVLGFDVEWPYGDARTLVLTTDPDYTVRTPNTGVLPGLDKGILAQLGKQSDRGIWVVGGGQVVSAFLSLGAIDEMKLCVIPVLLGEGIPLFPGSLPEQSFTLTSTESYASGAVMLSYRQ